MPATSNVIALDVGEKRIGVALVKAPVNLSQPLLTLTHNESVWRALADLIREHNVDRLVIGLPRNLDGERTAQTATAETFAQEASSRLKLPVTLQDEAVTSVEAEALLKASGKPYTKAEIDATAASIILDDYMHSQGAYR